MSSTLHLPAPTGLIPAPRLPQPAPPVRQHLRPTYAAAFQCITSDCEETCCQGWSVPIDRATWEKYRANPILKTHLNTLIVLNTSNPTTADYARMPLSTTGQCGFLESDSTCGIQNRFGTEMLSQTCRTYPRAISTHAAEVETALNLSCPEAARLVLLNPALLNPAVIGPPASAPRYVKYQLLPTADRLDLRDFSLTLLTDRSYPLWQRLLLLGDLSRRLQTLAGAEAPGPWVDAHPAESARLLLEAARDAATHRSVRRMSQIKRDPARQLQLVVQLLQLRISQPPVPQRFIACVQDFERGLGIGTHDSEEALLATYDAADRLYLQPLLALHPNLLENYLVNHTFKNDYPFGRQSRLAPTTPPNARDEHLSLVLHATLAQTLLTGIAGHYRETLSPAHVVTLVQCLARTIEHSKTYLEQMVQFASESQALQWIP